MTDEAAAKHFRWSLKPYPTPANNPELFLDLTKTGDAVTGTGTIELNGTKTSTDVAGRFVPIGLGLEGGVFKVMGPYLVAMVADVSLGDAHNRLGGFIYEGSMYFPCEVKPIR